MQQLNWVEFMPEDFMPQEYTCPCCRVVINELPMLYNDPAIRLLDAYFQQNPEVEEELRQDNTEINNEKFCHQYDRLVAEYEKLLAEGNERRIIAQDNEGRIDDEGFVNTLSIID